MSWMLNLILIAKLLLLFVTLSLPLSNPTFFVVTPVIDSHLAKVNWNHSKIDFSCVSISLFKHFDNNLLLILVLSLFLWLKKCFNEAFENGAYRQSSLSSKAPCQLIILMSFNVGNISKHSFNFPKRFKQPFVILLGRFYKL